ncbi:MAG: dTDP-4-dehydrorhamnose 3,5-epimerase [Candidatus Hydrogenedentes bacterium]|nr:dTDP-4-dehydrorhamnose 3,5-epimerase [Candidatus Hydrogenedentota bacterium]
MPLKIESTELEGVLLLESPLFEDERGYFTVLHSIAGHADAGFHQKFVQDNLSKSKQDTLRGMHYQIEPHGMGKLVRAVAGAIFDVAVDLRRGSPTFGKWMGRTLTAENGLALWIPVGFAHGFLALEPDTLVLYKCTASWKPEAERSLAYDDPEVGIAWPMQPTCISGKDREAPRLRDAEYNFTYRE